MQIDLSENEKRVLEMIVGNMSMNEIAFALDIESSVIVELSESIYAKLGALDARSAAEIAARLELVKL